MEGVGLDRACPVELARKQLLAHGGGVAVLVFSGQRSRPSANSVPELWQSCGGDDAASGWYCARAVRLVRTMAHDGTAEAGRSYSSLNQLSDPDSWSRSVLG